MAKTYSAIQTITAAGGESAITFSNIPQNYSDLKVVLSIRTTRSANGDDIDVSFNGSTSNISGKRMWTGGSSTIATASAARYIGISTAASDTTNVFSNIELYISGYASSTNKSYTSHSVNENNGTGYQEVVGGLLSSNSPITIVSFNSDNSGTFIAGSTFTLYGIGQGAKATGGTVSSDGKYMYHTFLSTGALVPTEQIKNAEVLLIAGGGGSTWRFGGGAGAGGVVYASGNTFTAGTPYVATVGAGGTAGGTSVGGSGNNSQFSSLTVAVGGGYPGGSSTTNGNAANGGSGGGGGGNSGGNAGGTGISGQGNNGGNGATSVRNGGGGGGAGAAGENANNNHGGNGGVGTSAYSAWGAATNTGQNISGTYYYAGGGGGGANLGNGGSDGTWDGHGLGG